MRRKNFFIIFILLLMIPININAMDNPYKSYWQWIEGTKVSNCIYIAWDEAKRHTGLELPYWGLAGRKEETSWLPKAEADGFKVGKVAKPNSIAVYSGHVVYVLSVSEDGKKMITNQGGLFNRKVDKETGEVTIEPKNGTGTVFNYEVKATVGPNSWSGLELFGFIYLEPVEGFVPTTTRAGESIPTAPTSAVKDYTTTSTTESTTISDTTSTSKTTTTITTEKKKLDEGKEINYTEAYIAMIALGIFLAILIATYNYQKNKK